MLKQHLRDRVLKNLGYKPTGSQLTAVDQLVNFLVSTSSMPMMLLKGFAGTGKTSLVAAFTRALKELDITTVLLAPTGRAAKVLGSEAAQPAYTIHKIIYRQHSSKDGFGSFNLNRNNFKDSVFIVDEASMISNEPVGSTVFGSGCLMDDLVSFVYGGVNCRLMLAGDPAQLPPVGLNSSPALEATFLEGYGAELFSAKLIEVTRQKEESGILKNATSIRQAIDSDRVKIEPPFFQLKGVDDVRRISGSDLMEEIQWCYDNFGLEETLVTCRSNNRANLYNKGIREVILGREGEITVGDYLLVMKNNYHWIKGNEELNFIANGDIARVVRIKSYHQLYGYRFADVVCKFVDYSDIEINLRILLDSIYSAGASISQEEQQKFLFLVMEDYQEIKPRRKQFERARGDDFYNALQVKFAYSMTCHKAQGGQWKAVFIDLGYFTPQHLSGEFTRWLYTAVTRATERLYLVDFPPQFFK